MSLPDTASFATTTLYYFGTFNPVHLGHCLIAQTAVAWLGPKNLVWVPAGDPPHRQQQRDMIPSEHRAAMVEQALAAFPRQSVSRIELQRHGPSYTLATLEALVPKEKTPYVLIGSDALAGLATWYGAEKLASWVHWLQVPRPNAPFVERMDLAGGRVPLNTTELPMPSVEISATWLRQRLKAGLPITPWCPDVVVNYMKAHDLIAHL